MLKRIKMSLPRFESGLLSNFMHKIFLLIDGCLTEKEVNRFIERFVWHQLYKKLHNSSWYRISSDFIEIVCSLPCSQQPAFCPCPKPN